MGLVSKFVSGRVTTVTTVLEQPISTVLAIQHHAHHRESTRHGPAGPPVRRLVKVVHDAGLVRVLTPLTLE